jgi:hypothetical protein
MSSALSIIRDPHVRPLLEELLGPEKALAACPIAPVPKVWRRIAVVAERRRRRRWLGAGLGIALGALMVRLTRERLAERDLRSDLRQGDATALSWSDGTFDAVVSTLRVEKLSSTHLKQHLFSDACVR